VGRPGSAHAGGERLDRAALRRHDPEDAVDDDLEESARFYEEDNGELHIRSDFLIDDGETPRNVRVAFILFKKVLFSVHGEDLPVFRLLRLRARRIPA
jgi:magnesium transporter